MELRAATAADAVLGVQPQQVYQPASLAEAAEALRAAAGQRQRIAVVGGGTELGLGRPPEGLEALVSTRRLARIVDYAPADQVVVAEAGVTLSQLQATCAARGQRLGLDAPLPERATLGGLLATGGYGPRRASFGGLRELVIGVALVRADGSVARGGGKVVKNVAGYDLPKLLCGSLGTLGLIAQVNLRLHPLPERSALLLLQPLPPLRLLALLRAARAAFLEPAALVARADGAGRHQLGLLFEGFPAGVAEQAARLCEVAGREGCEAAEADPATAGAFWSAHQAARSGGALRARLAALPSALPQVDELVRPLLGLLARPAFDCYPSLGLGFLGGDPIGNEPLNPGSDWFNRVAAELSRVRAALVAGGGSLVLEAAPAGLRALVDPWGPPPASFPLMQRLKASFDPERRLNPGRFLGGL
jgi:glycolate oxidase FAD binding subunit